MMQTHDIAIANDETACKLLHLVRLSLSEDAEIRTEAQHIVAEFDRLYELGEVAKAWNLLGLNQQHKGKKFRIKR